MKKTLRNISICTFLVGMATIVGASSQNETGNELELSAQQQDPDSTTIEVDPNLRYPIQEFSGNPFLEKEERRGINIEDPDNLEYSTEYDPKTGKVTIYRRIGNMDVRLPYTMTLEEYLNQDIEKSMDSYWKQRQQSEAGTATGSGILNKVWNIGGEGFETIFGSNMVNIEPQGSAELSIGVSTTKIDNPTIQERLRKSTTFDFDEKIQMSITGNIGDKMKLGVKYDTEATFEFENEMNLEYTGKEDEIIQKIEAGNVTLPLPGTLITGSQSLFGVKTELQFGKLAVTSVFSQQKGETSTIDVQGGAQTQEFEIGADQYDKNRHFFLSHYFRDFNYERSFATLPILRTEINITKVEVWITNREGIYDEARNILALTDLGEISPLNNGGITINKPPSNENDAVYDDISTRSGIRDFNQIASIFQGDPNYENIKDYQKVESARKLSPSEYTLNSALGFISLNSALNSDEVLAIAYEYTIGAERYQVGEFSNEGTSLDAQEPDAPAESAKTMLLKLLKPENLTPDHAAWNLMMKNIYAIGAYQVNKEDFVFEIAILSDSTGNYVNYFPDGSTQVEQGGLKGEPLLSIMELDALNSQLEPISSGDGYFDYVPNATIYPQTGKIIFPQLEPFGKNLREHINKKESDPEFYKNYVFEELYSQTLTDAEEYAENNKFILRGSYKSSISSEISLNAMDIPQGSVIVTAGGLKLRENIDYTVDYTLGRVRIINQGLLESGTPIQISLESRSLFNLQTKTMIGSHFDYRFNENVNIGATIMHLRERPLTQKVSIGDEPIANTIWGLNGAYFTESQGLTNLLNKIPLLSVKEPSSISFEGEFAQLIPGHPNVIDKEGSAYIDDFEGTKMSIDLKHWGAWQISSTPQGQSTTGVFPYGDLINDIKGGYNRAKLSWYVIDPVFLRDLSNKPDYIDDNAQSNHFVREIFEKELFPNRQSAYGQPTNIPVLNVAYYPEERGPYNFDTDSVDKTTGKFLNPEDRWGGMMRQIETNDFDAANIEYLEFWLMDPFVYDRRESATGDVDEDLGTTLYLHLGNISEDILRDSRKSFEQGLPGPNDLTETDQTVWGKISTEQSIVNAFSTDEQTRLMQDIGLDGLNNAEEQNIHQDFINELPMFADDPASDDFRYFLNSEYDRNRSGILDRYKDYTNPQGNSKPSGGTTESSKSLPDMEDINRDNTMTETESYWEYKVDIRPDLMSINGNEKPSHKYIIDRVKNAVELKNGVIDSVSWFQFRIPLRNDGEPINKIKNFNSIRFFRMLLKNAPKTTILRFASMDLIRGDWRRYTRTILSKGQTAAGTGVENTTTEFEIGAVNVEENAKRSPINYMLPPDVDRVIDPANPALRELNEQAISLKVHNLLPDDKSRGVYKNLNMDMRQYKRLKMWVHAEEIVEESGSEGDLRDKDVSAFIRMGSDFQNNYYEYEIPLELTPFNAISKEAVWPAANEFNFPLEVLQTVKLRRNDKVRSLDETVSVMEEYVIDDPEKQGNLVKVKGNPNLSNVRSIMIGIRNNTTGSTQKEISAEIWMNELRLTDFDEKGGWAANARMNVKLSDLGSVSLAGNTSTIGFGSIEKNVSERNQEDFYQYDIATNLELGKFLGPRSRLSVPFYFSYSKSIANPKYYPLDPDIPLETALRDAKTEAAKDSIREVSQSVTERKGINFTNVKLKQKTDTQRKPQIYDISNLSATYSYNESKQHDINTKRNLDKNYRGILAYNYNTRPKAIEPFKRSKALSGKALKLIKDFNFYPYPSQISYRWEVNRNYQEKLQRNNNDAGRELPITVTKDFIWNRYFDMRFDLTKSLKFDFKATNNARIDEYETEDGVVNKYRDDYDIWKDSVITNIMSLGRTTNYQHNFNVTYNVPINKLPLLGWTNTSLRYGAKYNWVVAPMTRPIEDAQGNLQELDWGNTISNSNNITANTTLNFKTLYNKSTYLRNLDRKYGTGRAKRNQKRSVRYNLKDQKLKKQKSIIVNHKLKTEQVSVRVFNKAGRPIKGKTTVINTNRVEFIPEADADAARIMVTGTIIERNTPLQVTKDYAVKFLTSVKNVTVSYRENNGTTFPGYTEESKFIGMSPGFDAPGLPFIMGWQDRDFALKAIENSWMTTDTTINSAYLMNHSNDFMVKATLEPIKGLRIDLNANRKYSKNLNEYYNYKYTGAENTFESGNFSMTYIMLGTSFKEIGKKGAFKSDPFQQFLANRKDVQNRLTQESSGNYGENSQQVLIPSLLAAYAGHKDGNSIFLDPFPSMAKMLPNWRITYDGLSKIKVFKKWIRSFDISHAYRSTYNVGAFATNLTWEEGQFLEDAAGSVIPQYQINGVTLSEQFSPLIQFNITWQNSLITRIERKKSRTINLSLTNNQLIENYQDEWVVGLGYRFENFNLIVKTFGGDQKKVKNDLNLRIDYSIRDNVSMIRKIETEKTQLSSGQKINTLKFTADYVLSDRFNMMLYYNRNVNTPYISLSYPNTNSELGVTFRFALTQ